MVWESVNPAVAEVHNLAQDFADFRDRTRTDPTEGRMFSHVLNPAANEQELLIDMPAGTAARTRTLRRPAFVQLERVLGQQRYGGLSGLAKLACGAARAQAYAAVQRLKSDAVRTGRKTP